MHFPLANPAFADAASIEPPPARRLRSKRRYTAVMRWPMFLLLCLTVQSACCLAQVIDAQMHHLRSGQEMEWDEFADAPDGKELVLKFNAGKNDRGQTLRLRQLDVK